MKNRNRLRMGSYQQGQQLRDRSIEERAELRRKERAKLARTQTVRRWRQRVRNFALSVVAALLLMLIASRMLINGAAVASDNQDLVARLDPTADAYLKDNIFRHFKFGIDRAAMAQELMEKHPEAGEVRVTLPLMSTQAKVEITGRQSAAFLVTKPDQPAYIIDGQGVIFTEVGEGTDLTQLPVIRDTSGIEPELGQSVTSPSVAEFIIIMNRRLPDFGYTPVEYEVGEALRQVNIKLKDKSYILKASTEQGAGQQLGVLKFASGWLKRHNKIPKEYLDIRVEDRVYFK